MITMLLGGLWHGASWNFIIWGALHGFYLLLDKFFCKMKNSPSDRIKTSVIVYPVRLIKILFTFTLVCIAWVFFRAADLHDALLILNKMIVFDDYQFSAVTQKFHVIKGFMIISFLLLIEASSSTTIILSLKQRYPYLHLLFSVLVMVLIAFWGTFDNSAFIYFQF